jgi:two-component system response regulator QseB
VARVGAMARRGNGANRRLSVGAAEFDLVARTVLRSDGRSAALSGRESDLLRLLAGEPDRVFSRDEIVAVVFPDGSADSLVDTYVHYLRRKLGSDAVRTVRGAGFRLGVA